MNKKYIFKSERLGFRNWLNSDLNKLLEINSDKEVMEFFPKLPSLQETEDLIKRMQKQLEEKGFCYFAVDILATEEFIGFIGLSEKNFESTFTPCIDIGWRLNKRFWNKGYATEGAKRCLEYSFNELKLEKVNAIAPAINIKSQHIMEKLGMKKVLTFNHPMLNQEDRLNPCVLFEIETNRHDRL